MQSLFDIMNETLKKFYIKNEINPDFVKSKTDTTIYNMSKYLLILSKYTIFKPGHFEDVSIGDIYGVSFGSEYVGKSIFDLLSGIYKEEPKKKKSFFKKQSDKEYVNRSNDNLKLSAREMIKKSNSSNEYITINRIDPVNNICLIESNGLHRYSALRAIYLSLLARYPETKNKLKEMFTLKTRVFELDQIKTCCYFIISHYYKKLGKTVGYKLETVDFHFTGRLNIGIGENGKINLNYAFSDNELIEFVKPMIEDDLEYFRSIDVDVFKSFLSFLGYSENPEISR